MSMLNPRRVLFPALVGALLVAPALACSSGDDVDVGFHDGQPDASGGDAPALPGEDGTDAAAPDDARTEDAGAAPRTCSDDFVCHTALPPKSFLRDVWSAGDGVVWAVGWKDPLLYDADGVVLRWDGAAWTETFTDPLRLHAVWGSSATDLWIGGDSGLFHGTGPSPSEITWTKVRSEPIVSIWGSSTSDVWAVGHTRTWYDSFDGKVLHFTGPGADGADGWEIDSISSRPAMYRKVWGTSAEDVWIGAAEFATCGYDFCNGTRAFALRRAPDGSGGYAWTEDAAPDFVGILPGVGVHHGSMFSGGGSITSDSVWMMGSRSPTKMDPLSGSPVFDVVFVGTRRPDGSGYTWSDSTFGTCEGQGTCDGVWFNRAVWGKAPNDVYLAGDYGQLRHWNGTSFAYVKTTLEKIPLMTSLYAMWGSSSTDLWIVGDEIALHKVDKGSLSQR